MKRSSLKIFHNMILLKKIISKIKFITITLINLDEKLDEIKINQGVILSKINEKVKSKDIKNYEFKIFSQWGDDGIIQHLINSVDIKNKTFIEFGIEDFSESNCRFLLMKDNWKGFVIDGSSSNVKKLKNNYFYWKYNLKAVCFFITKENINDILLLSEFEKDLGILSIDLDGNDYYIIDAIKNFNPRIVVCEFNAVFGYKRKISVPYKIDFDRTKAHYSNLYFGASLAAMTFILNKKGYSLVGTNSAGNNAFFVRNDLIEDNLEILTVKKAFTNSHFRESRDFKGNLSFITDKNRIEKIKGLPVYEVEKKIVETL